MVDELDETFDSALQETAQRLLPLAIDDLSDRGGRGVRDDDDDDGEDDDGPREIAWTAVAEHEEYLTYQLADGHGRLLLRSHDAPAMPFDGSPAAGFAERRGLRLYTEATSDGRLFLTVAEPLGHRREAVTEGAIAFLWPLVLLVVASPLAIIWAVRGGMSPVASLRGAIALRGGGNLAPIDDGGLPVEIAPIAGAVNRLLQRLRAALEAERQFTANSAHELRTPVASALAQVQRLKVALAAGPDAARAERIEAELQRLGALIEKLLQLSRAEAGTALAGDDTDLMPALRLVVDELQRSPLGRERLVLQADCTEHLTARLDLDAFAIALRNLIENALLHGTGPVAVMVADDAIHIVNGGPPVPQETLAQLKHRFARGPTAAAGSGLGLAIADTILGQAGARLDLLSPATGREDGFEAVIGLGGSRG
ncbi:MAG: HAMP domain-containing histidine kinase [Rhodospirillaceae bacterium]|nr:HAMP domain-containing histidine kinase [Rhodospirillaceae bacterium]